MNAKWFMPFSPTLRLALPAPSDLGSRVLVATSVLIVCAVLLAIIQPWKPDDGSAERPRLKVRGLQ